MTVLGLGLVVGLVVITAFILRVLWVNSIKEYLAEVAVGVELLLDRGILREISVTAQDAWLRLTHGKVKQCAELIVPILAIPVLILLYFVSAVVFLFWVFMPFLLLISLIP